MISTVLRSLNIFWLKNPNGVCVNLLYTHIYTVIIFILKGSCNKMQAAVLIDPRDFSDLLFQWTLSSGNTPFPAVFEPLTGLLIILLSEEAGTFL